jgi:hypothetical protein
MSSEREPGPVWGGWWFWEPLAGKTKEYPYIECPKCHLKSYHPKDIEHRFCAKCGFHDDLVPKGL